jgi:hypothetical protein
VVERNRSQHSSSQAREFAVEDVHGQPPPQCAKHSRTIARCGVSSSRCSSLGARVRSHRRPS